jgi:hypothetical protein
MIFLFQYCSLRRRTQFEREIMQEDDCAKARANLLTQTKEVARILAETAGTQVVLSVLCVTPLFSVCTAGTSINIAMGLADIEVSWFIYHTNLN